MSSTILLVIFIVVWLIIALYLFSIDRRVRELKKIVQLRENLKD